MFALRGAVRDIRFMTANTAAPAKEEREGRAAAQREAAPRSGP